MSCIRLSVQCKNNDLPIKVMRELMDIMEEYKIICIELQEVDDDAYADYDLDELDDEE